MFTKTGRLIAVCLLLSLIPAGNAVSAPPECKGKKSDRNSDCGDETTPGGEHSALLVTLGDDGSGTESIQGDGSAVYSDSEKSVGAQLGGQTQPNNPGIK